MPDELSHPSTSMGHNAFLSSLDQMIVQAKTPDELRLAGLLRDIYKASATVPAVVEIVNNFTLRVLNEGDSQ